MDTENATNLSATETEADRVAPRSEVQAAASEAIFPEAAFLDRRKATRYEVSARVTITVFVQLKLGNETTSEAERMKVVRQGFSIDLSPYGLCMVVEGRPTGITLQQLVGQTAKIKIDLNRPGESELNILGRIAWAKEDTGNPKVGIQFTEVPLADREVLVANCQEDEGELDQLSNLWELMVARPKNS